MAAGEHQQGRWWRFPRYEVDGVRIRPMARGALAWVDLRETYRDTRRRVLQPGYAQLATVARVARFRFGHKIDEQSRQRVKEWCESFGLLGILHQQMVAVTVPGPREPGSAVSLGQTTAIRHPGGWRRTTRHQASAERIEAAVLLASDGKSVTQPLEWLSKFFPDADTDDLERLPWLLEEPESFWPQYSEPIIDFFEEATKFDRILSGLSTGDRASSLDTLRELLEPIGPDIDCSDATYRDVWRSPSLIASLAFMLRQDLVGGRHIRTCETCDEWLVAIDVKARYCSVKCRRTAEVASR